MTPMWSALEHSWGWAASTVEYVALGNGSHHWSAADDAGTRRFVTVDDLSIREDPPARALATRRAFESARVLHEDEGLDFVVAPMPTTADDVIVGVGDRLIMSVTPWVEAAPIDQAPSKRDDELASMLVALHAATPSVSAIAGRTDFAILHRRALDSALTSLEHEWSTGPFAEAAREALGQVAVEVTELLTAYDDRVARAGPPSAEWVVTHGEPHAGNLIETIDGLLLVDWDTLLVAPPERDLWWVDGAVAGAYTATTGTELDAEMIALYRLWFDLDQVAQYTDQFRRPHRLDLETSENWDIFTIFLDQVRNGAHE